jgi:hypothetical protein
VKRTHLFEWEDQPWLPRVFRDFITDHLRYTQTERMRRPINVAIAQRLKDVLDRAGTRRIIDLCAGAGGPVVEIRRILDIEMGVPVQVVLTDLYPNATAFRSLASASPDTITARHASTSAFDVPEELDGVRTVFTALHHFRPEEVQQVLADAVRKGASIAVFEPLERTVRMIALVGLVSLVRGFTHTPRVGRLTFGRFVFTYLCPLAPAMFAWDGMVSAARTYTPDELLALSRSVTFGGYVWEAGRFETSGPYGQMPTTYLVGRPGEARARRRGDSLRN